MTWTKEFFADKKQLLNGIPERNRGDGFEVIFTELEKKSLVLPAWYLIVETGSMRPGGTLEGDGQSTLLFDSFVNYYKGRVISVDVDKTAFKHSSENTSSATSNILSDSIKFLWKDLPNAIGSDKVDLFYLDSFDVDFDNPVNSNLHHIKELTAISQFLTKGTLVAVDDCRFLDGDKRIPQNVKAKDVGKGNFVESFMKDIEAKLLFDGYQKVWEIQ